MKDETKLRSKDKSGKEVEHQDAKGDAFRCIPSQRRHCRETLLRGKSVQP